LCHGIDIGFPEARVALINLPIFRIPKKPVPCSGLPGGRHFYYFIFKIAPFSARFNRLNSLFS
jgi:hypothetical protein